MKRIVTSALFSVAIFASLPATAEIPAGSAGAIAHFNLDRTNSEVLKPPTGRAAGTVVSTRTNGVRAAVYDHFNADADSMNDLRGLREVTAFGSTPAIATYIVRRLRTESAGDE
ncbi:hypothetical protein JSE7799_03042 [Jannaschia seosinensis]|uniref:Uncharacterized protein n=1 Tax=Jannaschia seosinensis TaxID=313367 RepID=A0A0M7BC46_9RHOB|nr:hypothetical protein [Jannaschia seosinensis]CUH40310.1 hypothetical protein JSE7799_03042 [Jannaschia seosinensis]